MERPLLPPVSDQFPETPKEGGTDHPLRLTPQLARAARDELDATSREYLHKRRKRKSKDVFRFRK